MEPPMEGQQPQLSLSKRHELTRPTYPLLAARALLFLTLGASAGLPALLSACGPSADAGLIPPVSATERAPAPTLALPTPEPTPDMEKFLPQPGEIVFNGPDSKRIVFSFDDLDSNEAAIAAGKILDIADREGVKIVLFPVAKSVEERPEVQAILKRAVAGGHEIGIHSYDHETYYTNMTRAQVQKDIEDSERILRAAIGKPDYTFYWLRPPFGAGGYGDATPDFLDICKQYGLRIAMWSQDFAETLKNGTIIDGSEGTGILLYHANLPTSGDIESFETAVKRAKEAGLTPTTLTGMYTPLPSQTRVQTIESLQP